MAEYIFSVSLTPREAQEMVEQSIGADLVYHEVHRLSDGKTIAVSIFEKYYFRSKNRAALTVIYEDLYGPTKVKSIATGSSQGLIFNFDLGAADDFSHSVVDILKKHRIE